MRTITELIAGLSGLFALGVAGGLEKGMLTIGGAFIAWGAAAITAAIAIAIRRRA